MRLIHASILGLGHRHLGGVSMLHATALLLFSLSWVQPLGDTGRRSQREEGEIQVFISPVLSDWAAFLQRSHHSVRATVLSGGPFL